MSCKIGHFLHANIMQILWILLGYFFWQISCKKFGHFVNFSYIYFGQKCLAPKVNWAPTPTLRNEFFYVWMHQNVWVCRRGVARKFVLGRYKTLILMFNYRFGVILSHKKFTWIDFGRVYIYIPPVATPLVCRCPDIHPMDENPREQ